MFAVSAGQQVMGYQEKVQGVKSRNRARLKQFDYQNDNYLVETMLNNNKWKNDVIVQQDETDKVFGAMVNQWQQYDEQLDQLFANTDFKLQDSLVKMYKNSYAGEGTGVTAGRLAAQNVREHGYRVAEETNKLILAQKEVDVKRDATRIDANYKINNLFEQVRFAPIPGQTPIPPTLEAKPSMAGLVLGLASSAISAYGFHKMTAATNTGMTQLDPGFSASDFVSGGGNPDHIGKITTWTTDMAVDAPSTIVNQTASTPRVGLQLWGR